MLTLAQLEEIYQRHQNIPEFKHAQMKKLDLLQPHIDRGALLIHAVDMGAANKAFEDLRTAASNALGLINALCATQQRNFTIEQMHVLFDVAVDLRKNLTLTQR